MAFASRTPLRFASPDEISAPDALARVLGPIEGVARSPLESVGFSGASFERLHARVRDGPPRMMILKRVPLGRDWVAVRTGDAIGRTAALLAATEFGPVWELFHCPYLAYAADKREMALLMEDVGEHLFPDERAPLPQASEDALLGVLARLHARFWEAPTLEAEWLTPVASRLGILSPGRRSEDAVAPPPPVIRDGLSEGWSAALPRLPSALRDGMCAPADEIASLWRGLPRTLLHGDTKIANFALLPDGRVAAFDWSVVGAGPPTLDLGWYLAMNATRLFRSKEEVIERYRELLEEGLGRRVPDRQWEGMVALAVWSGARAMLWSKALAVEGGRPGAEEEWEWWVERLSQSPLP